MGPETAVRISKRPRNFRRGSEGSRRRVRHAQYRVEPRAGHFELLPRSVPEPKG